MGSAFALPVACVRQRRNTNVQVDVDGGGDSFVTVAVLNGTISNNTLASQTVIFEDTPVV